MGLSAQPSLAPLPAQRARVARALFSGQSPPAGLPGAVEFIFMAAPDYLICLNCESPCYVFEWEDGEILEALCTVCGEEDVEEFLAPEEFDELTEG